ncbi:hypothetical protein HDV02_001270 [Globomyces sp. JEL0801]|nr:hypothetical protein HDV02_001270 [Globomyces sp. JEL0801]
MASETDHIYSYASDNLQPIITNPECQEFIRSCIDDCPNDNLDDVDHSEDEFLGDTPSKYISCLDLKDMALPNFFGTKSKPELTPKHSNDSLRSISSVGIKSSNDSIISRSSMDSLVSRNSLDSLSTANDLLNLSISTPHFAAGKMDDIEHTLGEEKRKNPFKMPLSKSNHNSLVKPPLMELAPFKPKLGNSSQIGLPVSSLINPNLSESKDIVTIKSNNSPRKSTQFINQNQ